MNAVANQGLNIITLGQFAVELPLLPDRLAELGIRVFPCAAIDLLPPALTPHDVLLTDWVWMNALIPAQRSALAERAANAADWIALTDADASFKDQVAWQRTGVSHFSRKPSDQEHMECLVEDIYGRLNGSPIRVILLDDDKISLSFYGKMFKGAGMDVLALQDPLKVLEALDEHKPDVLVLDIEMPDCRGPELVTIVRQRAEYARLPVIFLTAMEDMQNKRLARAAAAEDFFVKPAAPELLLAAVEAHALRYRAFRRNAFLNQQQLAHERMHNQQLRRALDAHAIVSIADLDGRIIEVNDKFCAISGYRREELLGRNHRMIRSDKHLPEFYAKLWQTITTGAAWHGEVCNMRKDGKYYWVEATIVPFLDSQGKPKYISIRTDITALKEQEDALRASEERLRRSQSFANIGTWDWDIGTGNLYWSERIAPLFGYPAGGLETSYQNFLMAVHPDDRQAVVDAVNACVEHDAPYDIEHRVAWPGGEIRWLKESGAVVRDAAGNPLRMLGVVQDIDNRKRTALKLVEHERQLMEAQSLANIGNWAADLTTGELLWSDEVYRIFGHEPGSFTPSVEGFAAAVHPDDRERVRASENSSVKTGHHDVVHRIVRPDGGVRHVHELARAEHNAKGELVRLVGTVQDITARVETENRLRETEARFAFAVEGAGDGIWDWDMRTGAMLLSGHYEAMLGFARGEIAPTIDAWKASIHPDDLPRVQASINRYIENPKSGYVSELRLRCKDGGYKWILCRGTAVEQDAAGRPLRMIGIHSDISETKKIEAQLIQAREAADSANLAKSEFLSSMSHELRTPMNAIIGFAQMLEYDNGLNADQQDNVLEILKAGRHLLELINEVLDLAKIESGHINLSMEPVSLAMLSGDCLQLIQPLAQERGITLHVALPPEIAVFSDRARLKQILINLLSNAIKYNNTDGEVWLTADMVTDADSTASAINQAEYVRVLVRDTGPGIAPEKIAELFQPFNRLGAEASGIEGTGIGLTITQRLTELIGGKVGVSSIVGVGSTFWVELPWSRTQKVGADETAHDVSITLGRTGATAFVREASVLAIDDNPANLKLITQMLGRRQNLHLHTAHTPELGLELALMHQPDLILLDINMPSMDGYRVLKILKAEPRLKDTPVIAITANAMPRDIERGMAAGFADYMTKPLDLARFIATINRYLSDSKETRA